MELYTPSTAEGVGTKDGWIGLIPKKQRVTVLLQELQKRKQLDVDQLREEDRNKKCLAFKSDSA
ncbi:hypothetical protein INR49_009978 [Caranx melampygus]|nr:hypothetical protein INR49_009978 [Caranx melampygus]